MGDSVDQITGRHLFGFILAIIFLLALFMGAGPGVELVNTPEPWFGLPSIYTWGLLWYVVQLAVVLLAFFFVWPKADDEV